MQRLHFEGRFPLLQSAKEQVVKLYETATGLVGRNAS
jgi:hypothetical protein